MLPKLLYGGWAAVEKSEESSDLQFVESIERITSQAATKVDIVSAVTQFQPHLLGDFLDADVEWPISLRTTWLFPNGYVLVVAPTFGPTISRLSDEVVSWEDPAPVPPDYQSQWKAESFANGWRLRDGERTFPSAEKVLSLIEMMTEVNGEPRMLIPWRETWARDALNKGQDFFLNDWTVPEGGFDPLWKSIHSMFYAAVEGDLERQSPWLVEFVGAEEFLPRLCGYSDLEKFLAEVESQKLALVVRDAYRDDTKDAHAEQVKTRNPELSHLPVIWVLKDDAMRTYFGNGWVNDLHIKVPDPRLEKALYLLADEMRLSLYPKWEPEELEDDEWEPDGFFRIGSDFD
jgi:hypothetical protein